MERICITLSTIHTGLKTLCILPNSFFFRHSPYLLPLQKEAFLLTISLSFPKEKSPYHLMVQTFFFPILYLFDITSDSNRLSVIIIRNFDSCCRGTCMNNFFISDIKRHMVDSVITVEQKVSGFNLIYGFLVG